MLILSNAGATAALDLQRTARVNVEVYGAALPVSVTTGDGTTLSLPNTYISGNVSVVPGTATVEFRGGADLADYAAYSYGARGMRGTLSSNLETPIVYTGRGANGWQVPLFIDNDSAGQTVAKGTASISPNGSATSWTVTHGAGFTPTEVILTPITFEAMWLVVSGIGATTFTVQRLNPSTGAATAAAAGTDTLRFHWAALT
jgi:hypothetical protein